MDTSLSPRILTSTDRLRPPIPQSGGACFPPGHTSGAPRSEHQAALARAAFLDGTLCPTKQHAGSRTDNHNRPTGGQLISTREPRVNERIRSREVRLVSPDGGQIGIKSIEEARWLADQLGLDLVEVAADARPPVVRMMDYGKYKYDQSVKAREARKKQTRTVIKEVQFRPKIGDSDFEVKRKRVERFLGEGDKVKVTMRFRGREVTHPEIGMGILERLIASVEEYGVIETRARLEGRQMTMVLAPVKRSQHQDETTEQESDDSEIEAAEATAKPGEATLEAEVTPEPDTGEGDATPDAENQSE